MTPINMDQYRVIPTIAKIFEKCICDQIGKYNLLSYCQFGFRSLRNTLPVLVDAAYSWSVNIDNGLVNGVVFIDHKKAWQDFRTGPYFIIHTAFVLKEQ